MKNKKSIKVKPSLEIENFDDAESQPSEKWYNEIAQDPKNYPTVTDQVLIELKDEAKKCHDSEVAAYNIKNTKTNPDYRWMKTVMAKGTVSDKIAAYIVLVQESPVCNLDTIQNLISMVKVGKKKECIAVIENLSELFLSDLLRPEMKLKPFHQRPLSLLNEISSGNATTRRKYLSRWYFEDQLKESYTSFVQALNAAAHDSVESNKEKAIAAMSGLLMGNPEQEKNLLSNIINKLGDPSQKVASKTMYCLTQLLRKHSNMQGVVLNEIEKLLFRQNVGHKAQYYSLCFLSQFYLNHGNSDVARKLIELYFSFFKKCIKEGEVDSRMMSALLIGVNRAYPYAKLEMDKFSEHIDTMYRVVHMASLTISLHALSLLYQVSEFSDNVNDRFYSALYKKLLDPKVGTSTCQTMLLNLVYKAMQRDKERSRIIAFIKRLMQICVHVQPNFACGILYLISQIISVKQDLQLFTLLKCEVEDEIKQELLDEDDEEERYCDVKDDAEQPEIKEEEDGATEITVKIENEPTTNAAGWYHRNTSGTKHKSKHISNTYNPTSRNPLYCKAEKSAYIELIALKSHFHPSVSLFAEKILNGEKIMYTGDPLKDFTLIRFLERFVFKNPKQTSEVQAQKSLPLFAKAKMYKPRGLKALSVTSSNYLNEKKENIPVDEQFMFTYLQRKYKDKKERDDDIDSASVASEEFEEMLGKMGGNMKDIDDDIDFMNEIGENMKNKRKSKSNDGDDEDDDEVDEDEEIEELSEDDVDELSEDEDIDANAPEDVEDDFGPNEEDDELLKDLDDDDDMDSDVVFDSDEDEEDSKFKSQRPKTKKLNTGSIFASAEEFASLLEDEGSSYVASGSGQQMQNKDKADVKQLQWEEKRNHWLKGYSRAVGSKGKGGKKPNFNKKRSSNGNLNNNSKKRKRF